MRPIHEIWDFFAKSVKNPLRTGSIAPSSRFLARALIQPIVNGSPSRAWRIAELGPGTGGITKHILDSLNSQSSFVGLELNRDFLRILERRFTRPAHVKFVHDGAENLATYAKDGPFDYVISSLPWSLFGESLRGEILQAIRQSLGPEGEWATYFYVSGLPLVWQKKILDQFKTYFSDVSLDQMVWANFPPAIIVRMRV